MKLVKFDKAVSIDINQKIVVYRGIVLEMDNFRQIKRHIVQNLADMHNEHLLR